MIDFYAMPTPNCWRVSIALEEMGLDYEYRRVDIAAGEQFEPAYRAINPIAKIPAIRDRGPAGGGEPIQVFESGAILLYLAEKAGRFLPEDTRERFDVLQWLMWDLSGFGPYLGMCHAFNGGSTPNVGTGEGQEVARPTGKEAADYFGAKSRDLYALLEARLEGREYICNDYSIVDMSVWPHIPPHRLYTVGDLGAYPNLRRWYEALKARPAVQRGFGIDPEVLAGLPAGFRRQLRDEEAPAS
ncbi:MAG: glutathione S-transferase N-terminal domain-containing protein [Deltaproteobacteria bacterium]|nr:glutathione S-transferase N-terminal domain-containing protein [Deltaproteobacteria bacterium]MBW2359695.1 glutathione S-transferase N-terminal domain-containing protein [Deltaproteobacteria bacterium]